MAASPHAVGLPPGVYIEAAAARTIARIMWAGMAAFEERNGAPVPADVQAICGVQILSHAAMRLEGRD